MRASAIDGTEWFRVRMCWSEEVVDSGCRRRESSMKLKVPKIRKHLSYDPPSRFTSLKGSGVFFSSWFRSLLPVLQRLLLPPPPPPFSRTISSPPLAMQHKGPRFLAIQFALNSKHNTERVIDKNPTKCVARSPRSTTASAD